jgi:FkbM family methyltransferase
MNVSDVFTDGDAVREATEVVLYGAGTVGRDVCRVLTTEGIRVACILDQRAGGQEEYVGVPILPVESCPVEPGRRASVPVILSIFNRDVDIPGIAVEMRSMGFTRIVSFVDLHAVFPALLGDRFWLTERSYLTTHRARIDAAGQLWADEDSRALYRSLIALRSTGSYDYRLQPHPEDTQYFPLSVPGWLIGSRVRFVDCGAFMGDTLELMLTAKLRLEASAHFEPDSENFAGLVRLVRNRRHQIPGAVALWPCAVSDRSGTVSFQEGLRESSCVVGDRGTVVAAVALDDVLVGWRPTFIKMDIEGSEVNALLGARQVIGDYRPDLAVCVYHRPDHLWRIPLMLASWPALTGYRYYLRAHGFNGFDTVLYASPGELDEGILVSREVRP